MKIWFKGEIASVKSGIEYFCKAFGYQLVPDGTVVQVEQRPGNIEVIYKEGQGIIRFEKKNHFFRALGQFCQHMEEQKSFSINEEPEFDMNGIMVDLSRNAVLRTDSIKTVLTYMAVMGLNMLLLYMEDTYTIPDKPYFGYMRGRYSYEELKECDDFAEMFGIEIVPCIQTLGHLEQALKWDYAGDLKDTPDILLAEQDKTYGFIEEMIKAASAPFRSKRIHLGMDEAHNLGLGNYLRKNGYKKRFDIMNSHLTRVIRIANQYHLEPMIWSDMYFRLGSKSGDYYDLDAKIPEDIKEQIPENLSLVYWDYYHNSEEEYKRFIRIHKDLGRDVIFAGGIWTWNGLCVDYGKTFITTNAALSACKEAGIKKVFATVWGDNGNETNLFSALLGMQLYTEHSYAREIDADKLKARFEYCTGANYEAFMALSSPDRIPGEDYDIANPSKYLLWQDVLTGLFDKHVEGKSISEYYSELEQRFAGYTDEAGKWDFVFSVPQKLVSVLSLKSSIGVELKKAYDGREMDSLKAICRKLQELYGKINELRICHREQWMKTYKPFGWEVLDVRYGGLLARVETAAARIEDFISGRIDRIEELEEERLFFGSFGMGKGSALKRCNMYSRIFSASPIG